MFDINEEQREYFTLLRKTNNGVLSAEIIIDDARNSNSPLHDLFDWNDSNAAHQYRLYQASRVIRVFVRMEPAPPNVTQIVVSEEKANADTSRDRKSKEPLVSFREALIVAIERYRAWPSCDKLIRDIRNLVAESGGITAVSKERKCLKCQKPFQSIGPGNRMCDQCVVSNDLEEVD